MLKAKLNPGITPRIHTLLESIPPYPAAMFKTMLLLALVLAQVAAFLPSASLQQVSAERTATTCSRCKGSASAALPVQPCMRALQRAQRRLLVETWSPLMSGFVRYQELHVRHKASSVQMLP